MKDTFQIGKITFSDRAVPVISTELDLKDFLGAVMVRWGINRVNYRVSPGLYAVGSPVATSDVLVTANYKLTFDTLRKNLTGLDVWILVLDTKGVNVWCAAGKGTFGTRELVHRLKEVSLETIISHKRIIVPQLGATGVAAHTVKEETGFNVHYGPVRASDIKRFINYGYHADREMRRVTFRFNDRLKLIPNDFMYGKYYLLGAMAVAFLISGISSNGLSYKDFSGEGGPALLNVFFAYLSGIVITPVLLPAIPARLFSLKGFYTGSLIFLVLLLFGRTGNNIFETGSWFLIIAAISSFVAMNFTGSSTYTSLSGVKKEMKISLPLQIGSAFMGIVLLVIGKLNY
ncbi:MAG: acetyl-CoA synthase subunit gamma [Bacteroidetes bacterium]|nr:MAG: acetyl-CoA synthase subunit gamma [Bacteroidota bacterium]